MALDIERAKEIIERFSDQHILILGDLMLDRYIYGNVDRISQEAPVPVVCMQKENTLPGGACNVACNVTALGGQAALCGIIGEDYFGNELLDLLVAAGVHCDSISRSIEVSTVVKTRVIAENQQVCRVDREILNHQKIAEKEPFRAMLKKGMEKATGAIIEDYGKGAICQSGVDTFIECAREKKIPTGYDPKDNHDIKIKEITLATPNRQEAFIISKSSKSTRLEDVGKKLLGQWNPELLMITLGGEGMMLLSNKSKITHIPTRAREVFDVSGAGDTVIATCLLALASGSTHMEAGELANYAAGRVVASLGTATCTPEQLLEAITE